jgi:magnesium-transporting ATPase (P-type)
VRQRYFFARCVAQEAHEHNFFIFFFSSQELTYEAQSPDELALVKALQSSGVIITERKRDQIVIKMIGRFWDTLADPRFPSESTF